MADFDSVILWLCFLFLVSPRTRADAIQQKISTLSLDKEEKLQADADKAEKKAAKKAETELKKKAVSCLYLDIYSLTES